MGETGGVVRAKRVLTAPREGVGDYIQYSGGQTSNFNTFYLEIVH